MRRSAFFDSSSRHLIVLRPDVDLVEAVEQILVAVLAVEAIRTAGAALVDQHDVAIAAHAVEGRRGGGVQIHRRGAGTAGDQEQRVGGLVETDGGYARDEQIDLAPVRLVGFFGDRQRAAFRRQRQHARRMLETAGLERERGSRGGGAREQR